MSTYIKVDHSALDKAADKLDGYLRQHNSIKHQADGQVRSLKTAFDGDDYIAYELQWNKLDDNESHMKIITDKTKVYIEFLKYASSQYKKAQSDAVNRANRIPLW